MCVARYDLVEKSGLEYVEQSNECLEYQWGQGISFFGVAEGKLFLKKYQIPEDDVKNIEYYYDDLQTGKSAEFGRKDSEYLCLSLLLSYRL